MSKAINKLNKILSRLEKSVGQAVKVKTMKNVGEFARDIVVKRTRLGYGVKKNFGVKEKLGPLKITYVEKRKMFEGLDTTTKPKKSNLTRTGLMLKSMGVRVKEGEAIIIPIGSRNLKVAEYNAESVTYGNGYTKPARVFNRVSLLEFNQIKRYYRKTFQDLLKKLNLIK